MAQRTSTDLPAELLAHMQAIKAKAVEYGLDFFEVVFEMLPFQTMNQIAAYGGFPVRYPHWRFGMEFEKLSKRDAYGLGRIYEMVINNDPCYAYLQESNSVTDQKLVMAHVYGHADFFKNNLWFSRTERKAMDQMANHATRVRRHVERHGHEAVERFLDIALSLEHLIDPHSPFVARHARGPGGGDADGETAERRSDGPFVPQRLPAKDYMEPFINPREEMHRQREEYERHRMERRGRDPQEPVRDILLFLLHRAPLQDWQQDILSIVRDEAYYFAPQAMTKVMNEGWATYWHSKLMTRHFVEAKEIVDYAEQHSGVVHMPRGGFNPYKIGVELFKDIERRWDKGQHGGAWESLEAIGARAAFDDRSMKGREKIFEVRRIYNDVSFIDEFLTEEFYQAHIAPEAKEPAPEGNQRPAPSYAEFKRMLLQRLTNAGNPVIEIADANYRNRGELYLAQRFAGLEIELATAGQVLTNLRTLWGRGVHLQAVVGGEPNLLSVEDAGGAVQRERVTDSTPAPAHKIG